VPLTATGRRTLLARSRTAVRIVAHGSKTPPRAERRAVVG
jgi:hypothetical protein